MKIPTCFICYAWEKEMRFKQLSFLRNNILNRSNNRIDVILDKHNYIDNQNFDILRKKINTYDCILFICTPDLKEIINDPNANKNKDREVLKEYYIVKEMYENQPSTVFPIIFEGSKEKSLVEIFNSINAREYGNFKISLDDKDKLYVPSCYANEYNQFLDNIIQTTLYNNSNKTEEYESSREALDKLFILTSNTRFPNSCLVIPDLYFDILNQSCYFVAGRKGAGKSTLISKFRDMDREQFDRKYKTMVPISSESFNHEYAYAILIKKHEVDTKILDIHNLLTVFWQIYFILHSIVIIGIEIENRKIRQNDFRYAAFISIINKLKRKIGYREGNKYKSFINDKIGNDIFNAVVEIIDDNYRTALEKCKEGELITTSFLSKFNTPSILNDFFEKKVIKKYFEAISRCDRNIIISLDGFDSHSEDFRINTNIMKSNTSEFNSRNEYERLFFRTLIEVVSKLKEHQYRDGYITTFSYHTDFCIVIPKDRYDQIVEFDRDSIKKNFRYLSWSAYNLLELITKRMEYLISVIKTESKEDYSNDNQNNKDYFERMNNALSFFSGLPNSISMKVGDNVIEMSLFNYILRSSFWRPRDVISNLSSLLSRIIHYDNNTDRFTYDRSVKISPKEVKLAIKDNAKSIIKDEFIEEYKYVFRNLNDILKLFYGLKEKMEIEEFKEILNNTTFDASYLYDLTKVENKLMVLYQLGVVGIMYDKTEADNKHFNHHICFVFNEGLRPLDDVINNRVKEGKASIIFNPIFARDFSLEFNTKELIGNWSDDYIKINHKLKGSIKPL